MRTPFALYLFIKSYSPTDIHFKYMGVDIRRMRWKKAKWVDPVAGYGIKFLWLRMCLWSKLEAYNFLGKFLHEIRIIRMTRVEFDNSIVKRPFTWKRRRVFVALENKIAFTWDENWYTKSLLCLQETRGGEAKTIKIFQFLAKKGLFWWMGLEVTINLEITTTKSYH